jgi:hypothetical protein
MTSRTAMDVLEVLCDDCGSRFAGTPGELPGSDLAGEVVLAGCHYDGHDISQGAVDPAEGLEGYRVSLELGQKMAQVAGHP